MPVRQRAVAARPARGFPVLRGFLYFLAASLFVSLVLYSGALRNPFVSDDGDVVAGNLTLRQTRPGVVARIFSTDYWSEIGPDGQVRATGADHNLYRPVTIG